ncbi:MAG: acetyl-CoA carboxylase biotin carboxyl carrier protein [Acidobacteria bacterium]|nr:acetyl-CoA carboxylase biotin carboxyl carrier protein [Acidobacteriota bacterium]
MPQEGRKSPTGLKKPPASADFVDLDQIKELIDLLKEKGVSEFEIEHSGVRLRISRNSTSNASQASLQPVSSKGAATTVFSPPALAPSEAQTHLPAEPEAAVPAEELFVVRSPMVGTFYAAPVQGAAPFVQIGDKVQPRQVLCIIEAMKLMNEIETEIGGEIVRCYAENGQPVEYGEPLFDLRPAAPSGKRS